MQSARCKVYILGRAERSRESSDQQRWRRRSIEHGGSSHRPSGSCRGQARGWGRGTRASRRRAMRTRRRLLRASLFRFALGLGFREDAWGRRDEGATHCNSNGDRSRSPAASGYMWASSSSCGCRDGGRYELAAQELKACGANKISINVVTGRPHFTLPS